MRKQQRHTQREQEVEAALQQAILESLAFKAGHFAF
jgi:hypothetical protein